jgi:GAF domain-containing protein
MRSDHDVDALLRHAARADALVGFAQSMAEAVTDPRSLADCILDRVAHLVGDAVTVWTVPVGSTEMVSSGTTHISVAARRMLEDIQFNVGPQSADGITRSVIETGERLVLTDFSYEDNVDRIHPAYRPWMKRYGASSLVVLPMRARGRVVGAIGATRDRGRPRYTDIDVDFMQALADIAALALDNAHLLAEARSAAAEERSRSHSESSA